jgi:parallel beta-helix repeat protein
MDGRWTRREVLKSLAATAGASCLGEEMGLGEESGQQTSTAPATASRPGDDLLVAPSGLPAPVPAPPTPGADCAPPARTAVPSTSAPVIYEHTPEAGPDETFFLTGERLTPELFVWGSSDDSASGRQWQAKVQFAHSTSLAATFAAIAEDGPILVWAGNASGWSRPIRLNAPQPWWCGPDIASPGDTVRIFGRNLGFRPDYAAAFVYLALPGQPGVWLDTGQTGKYCVTVRLPAHLSPGSYEAWVHAGRGGALGWGAPVKLTIQPRSPSASSKQIPVPPPPAGQPVDLQGMLGRQMQRGGGTVLLGEGLFPFRGTLRVPKGVTLAGSGRDKTRLQLVHDPAAHFGPGPDAAAIWLAGDGSALEHLTVRGTYEVNLGVAIKSPDPLVWIDGCRIEDVRLCGIGRKRVLSNSPSAPGDDSWGSEDIGQGNYGVKLTYAAHATVYQSEIWGRAPLYFSGVRQCTFTGNDLIPQTVLHNAEACIEGRNELIEECIIEGNRLACPPGSGAGAPTVRRLLWFSTGRASVTHNWIADNGVAAPYGPGASVGAGQPRFGGVAGTDQNVGETILFEANQRTMFFGRLSGADALGVTLPRTLPPTPDDRMGTIVNGKNAAPREFLAHDAAGNETPFFPPDRDDGGKEPPIHEYYVSVFSGTGQGQTRRVLRREDNRLIVDRPWNVPPSAGSLVAIGTGFYQNLIVGNYTPDGMSGIQLWISCVENVIANNTIARQRASGIYLYTSAGTLASSMPRSWNRGIAPLFWNVVEGNRTEECSEGIRVASGDGPHLPIEFSRALGNVLRHNSSIRNREDGVALSAQAEPSQDRNPPLPRWQAPSSNSTWCATHASPIAPAPAATTLSSAATRPTSGIPSITPPTRPLPSRSIDQTRR